MKNLNVKSITAKELVEKWKVEIPTSYCEKELFIRCNAKGVINWESAPVYTKEELEKRGDYTIIVNLDINEFIESEKDLTHNCIGYIKTQGGRFVGIETNITDDCNILGNVYLRHGQHYWLVWKSQNHVELILQLTLVVKSCLLKCGDAATHFESALENHLQQLGLR